MTWIENKRVVITGTTSGIGREVAMQLASLGAQVVLACRDGARAKQVAAEINAASGAELAAPMALDTSDQQSIRAFAGDYVATYGTLDVLINNAGTLRPQRQTTVDGIELTFATNVLGYYLVTAGLLEALRAGAPARVVNVASTFAFDVDLDDPQFERRPYDGMKAYAQSKACDRMLTWAFARRLEAEAITFNAMAPGLVLDTSLYRDLPAETRSELAQYGTRSLSEGADTAVWLSSSSEIDGVSGKFFEQRGEIPCQFGDPDAQERLWQICEDLADSSLRPLVSLGR